MEARKYNFKFGKQTDIRNIGESIKIEYIGLCDTCMQKESFPKCCEKEMMTVCMKKLPYVVEKCTGYKNGMQNMRGNNGNIIN